MIVLATDAPPASPSPFTLAPARAGRLGRDLRHGPHGLRLLGRSGDHALAFSTAERGPQLADAEPQPDSALDPLFAAAMDATDEAILNSLFMADTTTWFRGHVRPAVPLDRVRRLCAARGVEAPAISGADPRGPGLANQSP